MRIVVRFCEIKSKTFEMEIDENNDVKRVKLMIEKLPETNEKYTKNYFHIFHRNIMLDNDRMVKFYAIEPNDEIYIGKIEHYLEDDDEIVELFVIGDSLSFEYVVVKRNDSISQLKSLISRIIPECVTVWSISGCEMKDDLLITDILIMNGCYKLIIGCGKRNGSISNYLKIHDQYLVSSYANKQKINFGSLDPYRKSEILELKEKLIELKESLENNKIIPNLNKYLSFIRSRYLFCMNTADEIWDICSEYWSSRIGEECIHRFIRDIYRVELNSELLIYSNSWLREYCKGNIITEELMKNFGESVLNDVKILSDNSFRSIVINALDNCINSLDDIFGNPSYSRKFIRSFLLNNLSDSYIDEILTAVSEEHFAVVKTKINNVDISLQIPVCLIKTNIQLKKSISSQTKIPMEQIYIIKYGEDEMSRDEENIGLIDEYLIALVPSMENIKKLDMDMLGNGAFGNVHLYEDKLTKCKFALKESRRSDENLNRDISIILQHQYSKNSPGFLRLYQCDQSLCIGMEHFSRGSLRSILKENKQLSERDIAQYSHQILIQIDEMHQEYIIHRDIKPDNVVIDNENNARLIDFGLSKNIAGLTDKDLLEELKQYPVGTMGYMAPELIRSEVYSEKVDIWSFGIMVVEMRTGQKPFHNMNSFQSTIHTSSSEGINLDLPDDTSEELVEFIHSCLNKNPNERATAKQLLESEFIQKYSNKTDIIGV